MPWENGLLWALMTEVLTKLSVRALLPDNKGIVLAKHPTNAFPKLTVLLEVTFDTVGKYQYSVTHRTVSGSSNECIIKSD